jgi:[NiFe] hydrogenase large subunit
MAAAHYIEALRLQARTARMHAVFGGKNPHPQFLVVGGITSVADLKPDRIAEFLYLQKETQDFIENVYIPDLVAVASFYRSGVPSAAQAIFWPGASSLRATTSQTVC